MKYLKNVFGKLVNVFGKSVAEGHYNGANAKPDKTLKYNSVYDPGKTKTAILSDGSKVEYDMCLQKDANVPKWIKLELFVFIGEGKIYSIGGKMIDNDIIFLFYKRKNFLTVHVQTDITE